MTAITKTSPLNLRELRKTQRRVAALLSAPPDFCICFGRRKRIPASLCSLCNKIDPRCGGGQGRKNLYRQLYAGGLFRACPHFPAAPHPTFVSDAEEDDYDDGFDEDSFYLGEGSDDGGMFDTTIVRDDVNNDPRLFTLPPMFSKNEDPSQQTRQRRKAKHGRLVPVVSENTFLSTNKRGQGHDPDLEATGKGDGLRLPKLANQRASLVAAAEGGGEDGGEGTRRTGGEQSRGLHSERIDRRVAGDTGDRVTRSDSAIGLDLARSGTGFSREKTDPPPQPIVVSIRNQDGEVIQKLPVENLPPGTIPSEAFAEKREKPPRKKREKKRRPRSGTGSASPSFSGSISISRETTLSGLESPDFFMSRLRSASWCECPDHLNNESRCGECRRVIGHEKWCVSRNTICQRCGKAFKRKYAHLERKSSFGTASTSGMIINSVPTSSSPSKNRHQSCSPSKSSGNSNSAHREGDMQREASDVRVRFQEDGKVVYPQWETFPDSGVEEDRDEDGAPLHKSTGDREKSEKHPSRKDTKSYQAPFDANVHKVAYDLALADARVKQIFQKRKKKSKNTEHPKGIYFSYFPLLKRRRPRTLPDIVSPSTPPKEIGVRADSREGKRLKVKKGLKHILGDVKLGDYYPGGKHYPRPLRQRVVY